MLVKQRKQVAKTVNLPAPVGGWNARDSIAAMPVKDAVIMDNFFCMPTSVAVRNGMSKHATELPDTVESLMVYEGASTKIFAASGTEFYDVTSAGAVGAAVVTGLTNARWNHINFGNSGGRHFYACNGVDKPRYYDGSSWVAVDGASNPAITGVTTTSLANPAVWKRRIWFIEAGTLNAWYLGTDAIGGAATKFDFGPVFQRGGSLVSIGTWTLDAGYGIDDHMVLITDMGEVAVYHGTDPASASTFALSGVYYMGSPIGDRCVSKMGGDLLVISRDGLMPLSKALMSSRVNTKAALTDKIQSAISDAVTSYGARFGWEVLLYPQANALMINVPVADDQQEQYVMNTITQSWSRFTGWGAYSWALLNDEPYFGGNGAVYKAWDGNSDNGSNIVARCLQAFVGRSGQNKRATMIRPVLSASASPAVALSINADYDLSAPTGTPTFTPISASLWGSALWGSAVWGGSKSILRNWQYASAVGYAMAPNIKITVNGFECEWLSTDVVLEGGGVI